MRLAYCPYTLHFREPGGTSRGILHEKQTYLLKLWDESTPEIYGVGESALFPGLSLEDPSRYEYKLIETLANIALGRETDLSRHPSIQFGLEQAILDFSNGGKGICFPSEFTEGKGDIVINGLIWMGNVEEMLRRIDEKLALGFHCLKLKIGAIDFREELKMIKSIREHFSPETLEIRVDANGGFNMEQALPALNELHKYAIHSIEQPIKAGTPELMAFLCSISPVPFALDEELIGITSTQEKTALLDEINPQYIILKPALCGGFSGASEWIRLAEERNIGWWVTSSLESNIGLSALAQWVATLDVTMPQGLGTGNLFTNNFPSPLRLDGEKLRFDPDMLPLDRSMFEKLPWIS